MHRSLCARRSCCCCVCTAGASGGEGATLVLSCVVLSCNSILPWDGSSWSAGGCGAKSESGGCFCFSIAARHASSETRRVPHAHIKWPGSLICVHMLHVQLPRVGAASGHFGHTISHVPNVQSMQSWGEAGTAASLATSSCDCTALAVALALARAAGSRCSWWHGTPCLACSNPG